MSAAGDWLGRRAELCPERIALWDAARGLAPVTYRDWNGRVNQTARFLRDVLGVRRGDRVAVLAMNDPAMLDLWFATGKLGALFAPLNWRLAAEELSAVLADIEPAVVIHGPDFPARAGEPRWVSFEELARREDLPAGPFVAEAVTPADPWILCGTGGSTGTPKAAVLSYAAVAANAVNTAATWGLTAADVALLNAPLFHTGGMNVLTAPLVFAGGASVIARSFDPEQVFDVVRDRRITVLFGVPAMFLGLQAHPRWAGADFSCLRFAISGGAPCPPEIFQKFWDKGVDFKTGYGLTEAGPNNFWLPPEQVKRKPGSVGIPLLQVDARIVDGKGEPVEVEEVGELLLRGPHLASGYWRRPVETAAAFRDGWLWTGDLARRDEDGFYFIVGRRKEMLISGGENVYPSEVESALSGHPAVADVAVIGVPDPKWGEVPRAVVVLASGMRADSTALQAHCEGRLARYKIPRSFVFVPALPRTGAGKVDRRELVRQHGT